MEKKREGTFSLFFSPERERKLKMEEKGTKIEENGEDKGKNNLGEGIFNQCLKSRIFHVKDESGVGRT